MIVYIHSPLPIACFSFLLTIISFPFPLNPLPLTLFPQPSSLNPLPLTLFP